MHADWQHWAALAIVAIAAWSVGKRLWGHIAAFRSRPASRRNSVARNSVPRKNALTKPAPPAPLMQIQTRPPVHLKRPPPPSDGPA